MHINGSLQIIVFKFYFATAIATVVVVVVVVAGWASFIFGQTYTAT